MRVLMETKGMRTVTGASSRASSRVHGIVLYLSVVIFLYPSNVSSESDANIIPYPHYPDPSATGFPKITYSDADFDLNRCSPTSQLNRRDFPSCEENSACGCKGTTALCQGPTPFRKPIPWPLGMLPAGIHNLVCTFLFLNGIVNSGYFLGAPEVTSLDLYYNDLYYIQKGAFRHMPNLTSLSLRFNNLSLTGIHEVLTVDKLEFLDLSENNVQPRKGLFDGHLQRLMTLCLASNSIHSLDMGVFEPLTNLRYLDLRNNQIANKVFSSAAYLPQLSEVLNMDRNHFEKLFTTCIGNISRFPSLTKLSLRHNKMYYLTQDNICLPSLAYLDLSGNPIRRLRVNMFSWRLFPALSQLVLSEITSPVLYFAPYSFINYMLTFIDLHGNRISFTNDDVFTDIFLACQNLLTLNLNGNDFDGISKKKFRDLFKHSPKLKSLSIHSSHMDRVSGDMFDRLTSLRVLVLSSNKLTHIPDGTFDRLEHLERLELAHNQLSLIKESTFSADVRKSLLHVDLSHNPFTCDCDLKWFQYWLTQSPSLFNTSLMYKCDNLPNSTVQLFYVEDQACLLSHEASRFIVTIVSAVLLSTTLLILLYRYRWHIRLVLYEVFRGRQDRRRRLQEQHFDYDVFVSFDSDDFPWVRQHLMPTLEDGLGLRLCIHERDFRPGKHIVENISHCVQASKKVMMLFSKSFAASPWCQFELNLCLSHVMENDDTLLVVFLHDILSRDMTPAMMAVMKTMTYIGWGHGPEARASFWGRIRLALDEVMPEARV